MRLVALFPLLFTASGNVLCSKFGGVWETLWIFKVARWTQDRSTKMNKSPTVCNGVEASSFEVWTANLAHSLTVGTLTNSWSFIFGDSKGKFCKVGYPIGPPNRTFRCRHFWLGIFWIFMIVFLSEKNQNLLDIQAYCIRKQGKNTKWAETFVWCLLLIFKVVYQDHLSQLLPFAWDFIAKGQRLVWGQVG